jgi:hypothetical protein
MDLGLDTYIFCPSYMMGVTLIEMCDYRGSTFRRSRAPSPLYLPIPTSIISSGNDVQQFFVVMKWWIGIDSP